MLTVALTAVLLGLAGAGAALGAHAGPRPGIAPAARPRTAVEQSALTVVARPVVALLDRIALVRALSTARAPRVTPGRTGPGYTR
ncbi:hypothetical protein AB0I39_13935 [Kitasatospora purpeofusca]|uniref:hypothetical protein n=1 Tax=Kitasatospora purpeofusca TaxID=67352 RepID=UPI0033D1E40C